MDQQLVSWLSENGGSSVRYRSAVELEAKTRSLRTEELEQRLLESRPVLRWLDHLSQVQAVHNSSNTALENAAGKLLDLGLRAGMAPLDQGLLRFRRWLEEEHSSWLATFKKVIVAWVLTWAGYTDASLFDFLRARLNLLYQTAREGSCNIYLPDGACPDVPRARQGRPVVNPELYPDMEFRLPFIHDLYWLAHAPAASLGPSAGERIETIVRYILSSGYQSLHPGYGLIRAGRGHYYAMGWSVHLPCYHRPELSRSEARCFVQRLELLAHFPCAREHAWFREGLAHLETFRSPSGTYRFPPWYLPEEPSGYWVTGAHMRLEEDRRSQRSLEVDSTFRMLTIQRLALSGNKATCRARRRVLTA
jgi:hypothetical protein